jgi:predicted nucleic acid-binding protein
LVCLDTSVWMKYLAPDELDAAATRLIDGAIREEAHLVAPAFAWAEIGSVLRKKVRASLITADEASALWSAFLKLPLEYVDEPNLRARAWELAAAFALPTLYDAAFLACTEVVPAPGATDREFWTADRELLRQLGASRPAYVRELGK